LCEDECDIDECELDECDIDECELDELRDEDDDFECLSILYCIDKKIFL
jgi:hypothetical protein